MRKEKALAKVSLRTPVERAVVRGPGDALEHVAATQDDIKDAGSVSALELVEGAEFGVETVLGAPAA